MNIDLNPAALSKNISHFLHRFHVMFFTLFILGGLAVATLMLYLATIDTSGVVIDSEPTGFDQTTIDKINTLRGPNDPAPALSKPSGRTNPFQ